MCIRDRIIAVSNVGIIDRVYEPYEANSITRKKKEPGPQSLAHSFTNNRYLTQEECASKLNERKKEIKALSSENVYLRKQIHSMIEENGILTPSDLNTSLTSSLEQLQTKASKDFPEGSSLDLLFN